MLSTNDRQVIAAVVSRIENCFVSFEQVKSIRVDVDQVFVTLGYIELRFGREYFRQVIAEVKQERAELEAVEIERREAEGYAGVIDGGENERGTGRVWEMANSELDAYVSSQATNLLSKLYSMGRI